MSRGPNLQSIRRSLIREDARQARILAAQSHLQSVSLSEDHQMPVIHSKPRMGRRRIIEGPSFRFNPVEVSEMEAILQAHNCTVPTHEILDALAQSFSSSAERAGKVKVSNKQVSNWFQNRWYAIRANEARASVPGTVPISPVPRDDPSVVKVSPQVSSSHPPQLQAYHPQAPQLQPALSSAVRSLPQASESLPAPSAEVAGRNASENSQTEFEAKSARDSAWYDVACFLSYRSLDRGYPEALVRFSGFGQEEDEWINIPGHVRQRSLPCESSQCIAVLPGDLILCFQEGKEQALYFDARVLDAQRRRHDVRGCRCRFLVRYEHDQSEEIVPLRKICRRPETDYRLQELNEVTRRTHVNTPASNTSKVDTPIGTTQKQTKLEEQSETGYMTTAAGAIQTSVPAITESKLQPPKILDTGNGGSSNPNPGMQLTNPQVNVKM